MDANLKARVEATMRIPRVVEDGIVRDLRLLYEYTTAMEAEAERLRQIVRAEGADPDVYCPGGLSKPELRAEIERLSWDSVKAFATQLVNDGFIPVDIMNIRLEKFSLYHSVLISRRRAALAEKE